MNSNYLSSKMNEINLSNKEGQKAHPVNINLSLLSNKTSVGILMSLASKNNSKSLVKEQNPKNAHCTKNAKQINFNEQDEDDNENKAEENDFVSPKNLPQIKNQNFVRGTRKGSAIYSMKILGKLEIKSKLINEENFHKADLPTPTNDQSNPQEELPYEESPTKFCSLRKSEKKKSLHSHSSSKIYMEMVYNQPKYAVENGFSVREFAYFEDQNYNKKSYMEDKGIAIDCFNNNPDEGLFCIFDGHGGSAVANYLQDNYPTVFKNSLLQCDGNIEQALKASFKQIDLEIKSLELLLVGSTGCVIYITKEDNNKVVYVANVGDTRCSLISESHYEQLSYDHRANDEKEKKRVINAGGSVFMDRVMGQLMVSRAFGDFELKTFGVKVAPSIAKKVIDSNKKNQLLIMASDGVWDIIEEKEMQNYILFNNNTASLCKMIIKNSLAKGSWDNMSCFSIKLT